MTTIADIAKLLGTDSKGAGRRLAALGYLVTCSRCGGSGHFSQCQQYGTMCFGCRGKGKTLPRLTKKIAAEAKARQDAGELAGYFAANRARAAAKGQLEAAMADLDATFRATVVETALLAEKDTRWGNYVWCGSPVQRASALLFSLREAGFQWTMQVQFHGADPVAALAGIRECADMMRAVDAAAAPLVDGWIAAMHADAAEHNARTPEEQWKAEQVRRNCGR